MASESLVMTVISSMLQGSAFTDETYMPQRLNSAWRARAACIGRTELFFAPHICWTDCPSDCQAGRKETGRYSRIKQAKALCNGVAGVTGQPACPVRDECLEWAIEVNFAHGFIGGKSARERKLIIKSRAATGTAA